MAGERAGLLAELALSLLTTPRKQEDLEYVLAVIKVQGRRKAVALRTGLEFTATSAGWQNRGPTEHSARGPWAGRTSDQRTGGSGCTAGHWGCKG